MRLLKVGFILTSSKQKWGITKMSDINTEGMAIAPGVMETIVILAVREVPGVASVGVEVAVTLRIQSGHSLEEVAAAVRRAVADAVLAQVGLVVSRVDITIDGIQFQD